MDRLGHYSADTSAIEMARVLLTAFVPFAHWEENSSWLAVQALTSELPEFASITTRLYPVDYAAARQRLENDLLGEYDFVISLGQSAVASTVELETIGINVAEFIVDGKRRYQPLCADGPVAYQTSLDVTGLAEVVNSAGIPCKASHHAGTYLCNATYYWLHYLAEQQNRSSRALFIHLPLAPQQMEDAAGHTVGKPMAPAKTAQAIRLIMQSLTMPQQLA